MIVLYMNQFKITTNITDDVHPVKETQHVSLRTYNCKDFTGEISSKTGIYSKFLYISRTSGNIRSLGEVLNPTIRIVCGPECIDKCMNLKIYNNGTDKLVSLIELSKTHKLGIPREVPIFKGWVRKPDNKEIQNINEI